MEILLTLPETYAKHLRQNPGELPSVTAVYSDPEGIKLGSGGGTVNVLHRHGAKEGKKVIIHSDGQSRRLPAYAACGKSLIPFPVFRWGRGQRIDQTLLDLQLPLLRRIMERSNPGQDTLIASGDVLVRADLDNLAIPDADVVCIGLWALPETASKHGVFVVPRNNPTRLDYMLQKPDPGQLQNLAERSMFLLDSGIWLLSHRAVEFLFNACGWDSAGGRFRSGRPGFYDLYPEFGLRLGESAENKADLSVQVVPLDRAEFYHFGSNADLLRSTRKIHDRVTDQREIWHKKIKPAPDIFVQNASADQFFRPDHHAIWIENAHIPSSWTLHDHHILTGIPENDWAIDLPSGICLDIIPVAGNRWCIRPYGFYDAFRGKLDEPGTAWMNRPAREWFQSRGFGTEDMEPFAGTDLYDAPLFPVLPPEAMDPGFIRWLIPSVAGSFIDDEGYREKWKNLERITAGECIRFADHVQIREMRRQNLAKALVSLAQNRKVSVFYQLDLEHLAHLFREHNISLPFPSEEGPDVIARVHDLMFRSVFQAMDEPAGAAVMEAGAFAALREGMLASLEGHEVQPVLHMHRDQILWARCPVRLDLAGGWTDTPPYCILYGGKVVNMAVELNGQPPIQVYIRPTPEPWIVLHSIDLGVSETITTYAGLEGTAAIGSAFAIPKAALKLAGFFPGFSTGTFSSLEEQLAGFGGGLDISLVVAVPKGSGLGTSSVLAATLLGGLSECCSLGWDRQEICYRTLLLEQMLTTGGGWQDQLGGIYEGVKLLETVPGLVQKPSISWAPDNLFNRPENAARILLYYTGITRVARTILADIVRGMFLNSGRHLEVLQDMKQHALATYEAIRQQDWDGLVSAIARSWELNRRLDGGTSPPEITAITEAIRNETAACKLLGAGGGGYLLLLARDQEAAGRIREKLTKAPPNPGARFVDWKLSSTGLEITRS